MRILPRRHDARRNVGDSCSQVPLPRVGLRVRGRPRRRHVLGVPRWSLLRLEQGDGRCRVYRMRSGTVPEPVRPEKLQSVRDRALLECCRGDRWERLHCVRGRALRRAGHRTNFCSPLCGMPQHDIPAATGCILLLAPHGVWCWHVRGGGAHGSWRSRVQRVPRQQVPRSGCAWHRRMQTVRHRLLPRQRHQLHHHAHLLGRHESVDATDGDV